ncbi:MAG: hypothetical protein AAFY88_11845, partial [Acidobacteriota bacterium]
MPADGPAEAGAVGAAQERPKEHREEEPIQQQRPAAEGTVAVDADGERHGDAQDLESDNGEQQGL